jgi:hypothetical protein
LAFNLVLREAGIDPRDVRLMRHQSVSDDGLTPYAIWRDDREEFERYQSAQRANRRSYFASRYLASFVVPPDRSTLFVGLYEVFGHQPAPDEWTDPLCRQSPAEMAIELDFYDFRRLPKFEHLAGCLRVEWGAGARSWAQRADRDTGDKRIVELTQGFKEPDFPGFTQFIGNLRGLPSLPASWIAVLTASRVVYLLTCPRTREQYLGSAHGAGGFWGRWQPYVATGHGGNVGLRIRDPSDYQVSVLEVLGSAATANEIIAAEQLWKVKLQSCEMGLNRN